MKIFGQLEKAQAENVTSDTAAEPKGMLKYRTDTNVMKVSDGATYKEVVDTDTQQTLSSKTLTTPKVNAAVDVEQIATPSNPAAGRNKLYFKSDGILYKLSSAGVEAAVEGGVGPTLQTQSITTSGNFVVPAGVTELIVEGAGGGGGGGGGGGAASLPNNGAGGGGGAGAYPHRVTIPVTPAQTLVVTLAAGGAGGAGGNNTGTNGSAGSGGGFTTVTGTGVDLTFPGGNGASGGTGGASGSAVAGGAGNLAYNQDIGGRASVAGPGGTGGATNGATGGSAGAAGGKTLKISAGAAAGALNARGGSGGGGGTGFAIGGAGGAAGPTDTDGSPGVAAAANSAGGGGGGGGGGVNTQAGGAGGAGGSGRVDFYWYA